jgi:hypothetical protein
VNSETLDTAKVALAYLGSGVGVDVEQPALTLLFRFEIKAFTDDRGLLNRLVNN